MGETPGAVVVPRVLSQLSGDPLPLVDVVEPYLGQVGALALVGPVGAGKSTAILAAGRVLGNRIALYDEESDPAEIREAAETRLVLYARRLPLSLPHLARLRLAPWGMDEALDVATALDEVATRAGPGDRIARQGAIRDLRKAHEIAADGRRDPKHWSTLHTRVDRGVVRDAARLLAGRRRARRALVRICKRGQDERQPMAASLLLALDPDWKPAGRPQLDGALLAGARWAGVALPGIRLDGADLSSADLDGADLDGTFATLAKLRNATLRGTRLANARLVGAKLIRADLAGAALRDAVLLAADLRSARLVDADLGHAILSRARLAGADLTGANLECARCRRLDLRGVTLDRARFTSALLEGCRFDCVRVDGACFEKAGLGHAHLTGSVLTNAVLRDAVLAHAKLADVSWEGADLRGADFRRAVFHMGSTRNGLVDSVIPCEGSRTGFYTDDYEEQHFKSPEEIRKANLRGADLRGASVEDADFYLVDLRDARFDARQGRHFRKCGAILRDKVV